MTCCGSVSNAASYNAAAAATPAAAPMPEGTTNGGGGPQPAPTPSSVGAAGDAQAAAAALTDANAVPSTYETGGMDAAGQGAGNVASVAPDADTSMAPYDSEAPAVSGTSPTAGAGAWGPEWEQRFTDLQLAPADIEFLRTSGFDAATLEETARQLESAPLIDSGAVPTAGTPVDPSGGMDALPGDMSTPGGTAASGASAWNADWEAKFRDLLAGMGASPDQVETEIAAAKSQPRTEVELQQIYAEMQAAAGGGTGASTGTTDPSAAGGTMPAGGASAWSPQWAQKFGDLMKSMGMPQSKIDAQLKAVEGTPMSEQQLQEVYDQMAGSVGAWDDEWQQKFQDLFDELKIPADQQAQAFAGLSGQGLDDAALQKAYDEMSAQKPGWNDQWRDRFATLSLPEELTKQLEESGAPEAALQEQFDKLVSTKMEYQKDGRLEKLRDAGANTEEQWGVMLNGVSGEEFDKTVEAIHSQNVPLWKRGLSMAVNLIPGVGTLQWARGKDFITGEKIDRSNPLNIGMAILSAIPVATSIRGGLQAVKGAGMLTTALKAGTAGAATTQALTGANMLGKFTQGLSFLDKVRVATPILNRFGDAAKMYQFGRGFFQGTQFLAAAAATRTLADGTKVIDKGMKATVFNSLKNGASIDDALQGIGRYSASNPGTATFATNALRDIREGTNFLQKAGHLHRFNPFSNKAGVDAAVRVGADGKTFTQLTLGANVRPGSLAGIAQIRGSIAASNMSAMSMQNMAKVEAQLAAAAAAGTPIADDVARGMIEKAALADDAMKGAQAQAIKVAGLNTAVIDKIGLQGASVAEWGARLGVGQGGKFRSLLQMSESSRAVKGLMSAATRGDNAWANGARAVAGWAGRNVVAPTAGLLTFGVLSGQTGKMTQPFWDYYKNKGAIEAEQRELDAQAEQEQAQLEQQYAEMQARNGGVDPNAGGGMDPNAGTGMAPTGPTPGMDAGSTSGGGVYVDPQTGWYVDSASGLMADPQTGTVVDPRTGQVVGQMGTPEPGSEAAAQAAAMAGGGPGGTAAGTAPAGADPAAQPAA